MSLDTRTAYKQIQKISDQIEDISDIRRGLLDYQKRLNRAWSAREVSFLNQAISDIISQSSRLERQLEHLQRDMDLAVEDILEEEAERESVANAILG